MWSKHGFTTLILCALFLGAGCGDSDATTTATSEQAGATQREFLRSGARVDRCAKAVGVEAEGGCTIAYEDVAMRQCPDGGPGGGDLSAGGISCRVARQLRVPVAAGGFEVPGGPGVEENVYRPWLAEGGYEHPKPQRAIGWTCFKYYDPDAQRGIRNLCWNGHGGVFAFTFG